MNLKSSKPQDENTTSQSKSVKTAPYVATRAVWQGNYRSAQQVFLPASDFLPVFLQSFNFMLIKEYHI